MKKASAWIVAGIGLVIILLAFVLIPNKNKDSDAINEVTLPEGETTLKDKSAVTAEKDGTDQNPHSQSSDSDITDISGKDGNNSEDNAADKTDDAPLEIDQSTSLDPNKEDNESAHISSDGDNSTTLEDTPEFIPLEIEDDIDIDLNEDSGLHGAGM